MTIPQLIYILQRCRQVCKSGWASNKAVGIICPVFGLGLIERPNFWAKAYPAHPLAASLDCLSNIKLAIVSLCHLCILLLYYFTTYIAYLLQIYNCSFTYIKSFCSLQFSFKIGVQQVTNKEYLNHEVYDTSRFQ